MKRRTQQCIAAFAITVIVIGALCGFVAVDLSTDRYMPGEYVPLFQVTDIGPEGMRVAWLGDRYIIASGFTDEVKEQLWRFRGLLPGSALITATAATQAYMAAVDYIAENQPIEEPW